MRCFKFEKLGRVRIWNIYSRCILRASPLHGWLRWAPPRQLPSSLIAKAIHGCERHRDLRCDVNSERGSTSFGHRVCTGLPRQPPAADPQVDGLQCSREAANQTHNVAGRPQDCRTWCLRALRKFVGGCLHRSVRPAQPSCRTSPQRYPE